MANSRSRTLSRSGITAILLLAWMTALPSYALKQQHDPEEEYVLKAREYLGYITTGNYEAAADITDFRGLGQFLVEQRIAFLKNENPEMTKEEEQEARAHIRAENTNEENLRQVILSMLNEANTEGMDWQIVKSVTHDKFPQARIFFANLRRGKDGPVRSTRFAVLRVGPELLIAPQIIEQLTPPPAKAATTVEPPKEVIAIAEDFWKYWSEGALDKAYDLGGAELKRGMPMLKFFETAQAVISQIGVLTTWELGAARQLNPGYLRLGYDLECTTMTVKGVLDFQENDGEWELRLVIVPYMGE